MRPGAAPPRRSVASRASPRLPRRHRGALACLVLVLLFVGFSIGSCAPGPRTPNLVLVTLDTTRSDHSPLYGYPRPTTPHMVDLARTATTVEVAYAASATTGPSHATLFTGLHPPRHQVYKNGLVLAERFHTLAEILNESGFESAAFVSSSVLDSRFGYGQGFETYDDEFVAAEAVVEQDPLWDVDSPLDRRAEFTTDRALDWLRRVRGSEPFFLFVHYFDPHNPYEPPSGFDQRFSDGHGEGAKTSLAKAIADYDEEILYTDRHLGRLLDALDSMEASDDTMIVVTADHGEGLMAHGHPFHGIHLYEEAVRVPLVIQAPRSLSTPSRLAGPVHHVDLLPTILDLLGLGVPEETVPGISLEAALRGRTSLDPARPIFLFRRHYDGSRPVAGFDVSGKGYGLRKGAWKYIRIPEEGRQELYFLADDPGEKVDLADERPERARRMSRTLEEWVEQTAASSEEDLRVDRGARRKLEALGYTN